MARRLNAVLSALAEQSDSSFEVVVSDDGSGPATRAVVERWSCVFESRLTFVWQPDEGFRQALALNRGALCSTAEHLVFIHGESIPRRHFVRTLRSSARSGWFAAGRRIELSPALTDRVLAHELPVHRWSLAR